MPIDIGPKIEIGGGISVAVAPATSITTESDDHNRIGKLAAQLRDYYRIRKAHAH